MRHYHMRTERLGFGTWTPDDLDLAMGLWGDLRVTELIGGPFSRDSVERRLAQEIASQAEHGFQYWPVFRLPDAVHVGCCGLRPVPGRDAVVELGFHLRADQWGRGYATEAARAAIDHAFGTLRMASIVAGHNPGNDASRRVLLRLGFRYVRDEFYAPTGLDHPSYELTREAYDRARAEAPPAPG
jgi:RimJ/RimL family protein N-acetyltransferase